MGSGHSWQECVLCYKGHSAIQKEPGEQLRSTAKQSMMRYVGSDKQTSWNCPLKKGILSVPLLVCKWQCVKFFQLHCVKMGNLLCPFCTAILLSNIYAFCNLNGSWVDIPKCCHIISVILSGFSVVSDCTEKQSWGHNLWHVESCGCCGMPSDCGHELRANDRRFLTLMESLVSDNKLLDKSCWWRYGKGHSTERFWSE
jgi:hypothetical protein